jgi:quercetin dioxygenase-like cupin family protein
MLDTYNFYEEAKKLEKSGEFVRKRVSTGDVFDIDIYVYANGGGNKYHTCSEDEYFYILKGKAEMNIENNKSSLKEGEGIMVKAGLKHKHSSEDKLWMIVISKWPHEHIYFD